MSGSLAVFVAHTEIILSEAMGFKSIQPLASCVTNNAIRADKWMHKHTTDPSYSYGFMANEVQQHFLPSFFSSRR